MKRRLTEDDVITAAQLAGVPPELALAIWGQESSSGRNAKTSSKGAVGDFQVMPATFRRYMPDGDINNPVDNMQAGLAVLADGLRKAKGDHEGAAQFYYHGRVLPEGAEGPNSGAGTPSTRQYGQQVVARAQEIRQRNPALGKPTFVQPTLRLNEQEVQARKDAEMEPLLTRTQNDVPDIPGLTKPLNGASSAYLPAIGEMDTNYDLDNYVRRIVDQEFKNA
jgi:hypothetical protein